MWCVRTESVDSVGPAASTDLRLISGTFHVTVVSRAVLVVSVTAETLDGILQTYVGGSLARKGQAMCTQIEKETCQADQKCQLE